MRELVKTEIKSVAGGGLLEKAAKAVVRAAVEAAKDELRRRTRPQL